MSKDLKPFFCYFGGKWRGALKYPQPTRAVIVEPFAGAAGYSTRNYKKEVILIDKDPVIARLWAYLINASSEDVLSLPLLKNHETVDSFGISQEEKSLIGFWLNKGTATPCKAPGKWMRGGLRPASFWGKEIRERIAGQVNQIKHWHIKEGDFHQAPDIEATWFIDPPYQVAGKFYKFNSKNINYEQLSTWCRERKGETLVCENKGAEWLPFKHFTNIKTSPGKHRIGVSNEVVWCNNAT